MNEEGIVRIALTKGQFAIVDAEDAPELMKYRWSAIPYSSSGFRAVRHARFGYYKYGNIYMHRQIMNCPPGMEIDHIDGDALNNRRCNLRICTHAENGRNTKKHKNGKTSRFKGVSWDKVNEKWIAQITINGRPLFLGRYDSEEEAASRYNEASFVYYGEFARPNTNNQTNQPTYVRVPSVTEPTATC